MNDILFYYKHWMSGPRGGYDKVNITKNGKVYYVHLSLLHDFLEQKIQEPHILITEGGDLCLHETPAAFIVGNATLSDVSCVIPRELLLNPNIRYWLSTNNNTYNIPINTVPCGLYRQNNFPDKISVEDKINKLLVCFRYNSHPIRHLIVESLRDNPNVDIIPMPSGHGDDLHKELLNTINKYKYLVCPPSNGLDTTRIWEATLLDTIPITYNRIPYYKNIRPLTNMMSFDLLNLNVEHILNSNKKMLDKTPFLTESYWKESIQKLESMI